MQKVSNRRRYAEAESDEGEQRYGAEPSIEHIAAEETECNGDRKHDADDRVVGELARDHRQRVVVIAAVVVGTADAVGVGSLVVVDRAAGCLGE